MDIYKHKVEGYVIFWGVCKMSTALGSWKEGTMYRKLQLTKGTDITDESPKGTANLLPQVFVVPTQSWKKHVKRFGVVDGTHSTGQGEGAEVLVSEDGAKGSKIDEDGKAALGYGSKVEDATV